MQRGKGSVVFSLGQCARLALVVFFLPYAGSAQSFTASLQGTVTDASGALVPGAKVTLTNEATNTRQSQQTNERGMYFFTLLPPGGYKLAVEMPGFQASVHAGMQLQVQQQATLDVVLTPGDVSTSVVVTGESPRLDSVTATLGRVIENKSVLNMPLSSRNTLDLALLAPGVVGSPGGTGTNFISNGARNSQSDVLIDGVTSAVHEQGGGNTDVKFRPSVEAVQEFKVQTNSFSSEYGFSGGTVLNMVMRSGTNDLHGSLFEFLRNSSLNSNNFFANRSGRKLVPFRRNQFGGAVGGPVWLPHVYQGKDKTFFFFHYEGTKQSSQSTALETVPSVLQKQGDFSQTMDSAGRQIKIFDPYAVARDAAGNWARQAFPGNVIPRTRFDPVGAALMSFYPTPNLPGNPYTQASNLFNSGSSVTNAYQATVKLDHNFSERRRLNGRFSRSATTTEAPSFWGDWMNPSTAHHVSDAFTLNPTLDYTHVLSPTAVLSLRYGMARQFGTSKPYFTSFGFDPKLLGFRGPLDVPIPPRFEPEAYAAVGPNRWGIIRRGEDVNHLAASMSKVKGKHAMKFGAEARLYRLNYGQPGMNAATFSFSRRITMADPFRSDSLQGDAIASMLLGWGGGGQDTDAFCSWAYQSYAWFYQNDMQITPRFTLNLGLRYELPLPETERYNRASWVDPLVKSPISVPQFANLRGGLQFADSKTRRPYDVDTNNWAPRAGFAYNFMRRMVMRGGYGIYYGLTRAQMSSPLGLGFRTSTSWVASLDSNVTQYAPLNNPFRDGISQPIGNSLGLASYLGRGISGPIRKWSTTPYYQQWSFSIERELPVNSVVEVAYSGSRGVHLGFGNNVSQNRINPQYYSLGTTLNDLVDNPFYGVITDPLSTLSKPTVSRIQLLRPYPHFTGLSGYPADPVANSIYHAAQFKFTKRFSHHVNFSGHYTFAKMIDDNSLSSGGMSWLGGDTPIQSYGNLRLERSVSVRDITHRVVMDFGYELPFGRSRAVGTNWHPVVDGVLGGWQVNGILTFQSGTPLVPYLSGGTLPDATQRPNLLSEPALSGPVSSRLNRYLDPDAFSRPAPYTPGNAPRTLPRVRAPGQRNADMSLFKNVYLSRERDVYLQVRGEAFNITNTPIFGEPNVTVGSTSFGVISSQANGPRQVQLALKLYF